MVAPSSVACSLDLWPIRRKIDGDVPVETSVGWLGSAWRDMVERDGGKAPQVGIRHDLTRLDSRGIGKVEELVWSCGGFDGLQGEGCVWCQRGCKW